MSTTIEICVKDIIQSTRIVIHLSSHYYRGELKLEKCYPTLSMMHVMSNKQIFNLICNCHFRHQQCHQLATFMFISAPRRWVVDPVLDNVLDNITSAIIKSKTLTFLVASWMHSKRIDMEVLLYIYIFVYSAFVNTYINFIFA